MSETSLHLYQCCVAEPEDFQLRVDSSGAISSGVIGVPGIATANPDHLSSPESAIRFSEAITGVPG